MSSDPIVTSGVSVGDADGPVPLRQEIRSLEKNFPDQWNLYLLGLQQFQGADETDLLSYYQIAGIHGRPFTPYNGVGGDQVAGYCTHSSILFPTWHRPYLALFEEVLYSIVQKKATEFSQQEGQNRYVAAAKDFRMPYWDWAAVLPAGTSPFPASFSTAKINVVTPGSNGVAKPIDNPLYSFKFHPLNPNPGDFDENSAIGSWEETVRRPIIDKNGNPVSQNGDILNGGQTRNLRESLFGLVTSIQDYQPFSNNEFGGTGPGQYSSLETIHDNIHVAVGGNGHMGLIEYAAFDPVFWLHHTNVDRCFAIWQALYPDSYVVPQNSRNDTLTTQAGTEENETSGLTPFWEDSNDFWSSDGVRKTGTFGYAYPETQAWKFSTPEQYKADVTAVFRRLYGGSNLGSILAESTPGKLSSRARLNIPVSASVKPASKAPAKPAAAPAEASFQATSFATSSVTISQPTKAAASVEQVKAGDQKPLAEVKPKQAEPKVEAKHENPKAESAQGNPKSEPTHGNPKAEAAHGNPKAGPEHHDTPKHRDITDLAINGKYLEWMMNFKVEKHSLGGTFTVHVFLGDFDRDDSLSWHVTDNKVGSFNVLGDSEETGCGKCKNDQSRQLQVTGQVPLTLALAERYLAGQLANLKPENVIPFLQKHLHWRVTLADGTEIPRGQVPSLTVSVHSNEVTVPTSADTFPEFSDHITIHPEVTTARSGDGRGEGTGLTDVSQS